MSEVDDDEGARRFEQDLEFVQSLANPRYLNHLALYYMDDDAFLGYLQYLAYWTKPEFARFIIYPGSLQALELILQSPAKAAKLLKDGMFCEHLLFQQRCGWQS